jgi:hypothetical protein
MVRLLNSRRQIRTQRRSLLWAGLGAIVGIGLGFVNVFEWLDLPLLPDSVVARVNHVDIASSEYEKALSMFASEKRDPLTDQDRVLVLERLIEEELLVQHGLSLGLVRKDPRLRKNVIQSLVTGITVEYEAAGAGLTSQTNGFDQNADAEFTQERAFREFIVQLRDNALIEWVN